MSAERKVPIFKNEIGREDKIFFDARPEDGAIVADPQREGLIAIIFLRERTDVFDNFRFAHHNLAG